MLFGLTIATFTTMVSYMIQIDDMHKSMDKKAIEVVEIKKNTILKPAIKNMDNLTKALGSNKIIREFVLTKDPHKQKELEEIFLSMAQSQDIIMQARLIDKEGNEIIRIDRSNEDTEPFIVEKSKLQNKSDRDYFKTVSQMKAQTIWHSKIDLNMEQGKVEIPYKSTIRVAMPIFDGDEFAGMVIVNLLTNTLFSSISTSTAFEHYILDKDNNYILHSNPQFSFNKYKNITRKISDDFPDGLDAKGIYEYPLNDILHNGDDARFIFKIKAAYEKNLINETIKSAIIIFILTIILSFILALYISRAPAKMQKALLTANDKLNEFAEIVDKYIITATTAPDSTIIKVSSAFAKSSGYSKEELIGQTMNIIRHPDTTKKLSKELWDTILSGKIWSWEIKNKNKNGDDYWLEEYIIPTLTPENTIESFVSLAVDITAKKELEKMASIDKLTGIYNRRMIDEFMKIEIAAIKRHPHELSMIMLDIDHFKSVNDTYGHQIGDIVLSKMAKMISENTRNSDIFGRWGGEEFIIICPDTSIEDAFILAEKLRNIINNFSFPEVGHKTISLGISDFKDNDDAESLIKKADNALYKAKNSGRNKSVVYVKELTSGATNR
jgi:diguanylate cyclase (GGDEF)-like protein/PAS domain S-box-containing protein